MNSDKNQNSDIDLSKFFEKEAAPNVRPVTIRRRILLNWTPKNKTD